MNKSQKIQLWNFIALMVGTLALSLAPIFVRLSDTSSSSTAFWRMAIATPFLALAWVLLPAPKQTRLIPSFKDYVGLALVGIFFAADVLCWNISLEQTTVANATLFVNFASLFVALLSWQLLKQPPSNNVLIGMGFAIMGSIFLVWPHFQYDLDSLMGDGIGLLAGFFYGAYILGVQVVRPVFSTMTIMTITGIITGVIALAATFVFDHSLSVGSTSGWAALFGLAIVVQTIGQSLLAYALLVLPATLSSVVLLLQPVLAALIAAFLFEETLIWIQILGMGIILFGISYAKLASGRKHFNASEEMVG